MTEGEQGRALWVVSALGQGSGYDVRRFGLKAQWDELALPSAAKRGVNTHVFRDVTQELRELSS